jgi:hypothetical protein
MIRLDFLASGAAGLAAPDFGVVAMADLAPAVNAEGLPIGLARRPRA